MVGHKKFKAEITPISRATVFKTRFINLRWAEPDMVAYLR